MKTQRLPKSSEIYKFQTTSSVKNSKPPRNAVKYAPFPTRRLNQQAFIMDLSFNPELTDELMVIYFNLEKQVFYVTHES